MRCVGAAGIYGLIAISLRLDSETISALVASASARAAETQMRVPVNVPGPRLTAMRSSAPNTKPASAMTASIIGSNRSAWPLCIGSKANAIAGVSDLKPRPAATEHASKQVSNERIFISAKLYDPGHFVEIKPRRPWINARRIAISQIA